MAYHFDIEDSNWGGYRPGSGRKENFDTQFVGPKNPHSVYCTSLEIDYIKFFLLQQRALTVLMEYEPVGDNPNKYNGDYDSWERDYKTLLMMNLFCITVPEQREAKKVKIQKILNRCLKK